MSDGNYQEIFPIDKSSAEQAFSSGDVEKNCNTLVAIAYHEQDWKWVQNKCLYFLMNDNPKISGLAATCLGHVARIHRQIEKDKVIPPLHDRLKDLNIAGRIEDALSDIEMFT